MPYPVHIELVRGESLSIEVRFVGENITTAALSAETSAGIAPDTITLSKITSDTVLVSSEQSISWQVGTHALQVWLRWTDSPLREVGQELLVVVTERLTFWGDGTGVIDGGTPYTDHETGIDGGVS